MTEHLVTKALRDEADFIVHSATERLRARYGTGFESALSVGALGSVARGDLCAVSDIDYYVAFDSTKLGRGGEAPEMANTICALTEHVCSLPSQFGLAERFSVFWTTLECLQHERYDVGRWGAYDREVLRQQGRHLAGYVMPQGVPPRVPHATLLADSARFLVDVLRKKLESARVFKALDDLGGPELERLGAVVLVKAILMPVRLSYLLLSQARDVPIVNTSSAISACGRAFRGNSWWQLVDAAEGWRHAPPRQPPDWAAASALLAAHLRDLYRCCLGGYIAALQDERASDITTDLAAWNAELAPSQNSL